MEDILIPISLFLMIVGIVWISVNASSQKRKATLKVVEEAIRSGQTLTPDTVKALGMPKNDGNGDLKAGSILVAVALAFILLGFAISGVEGDPEVMYIMPAVAAFPGLIGLVLIGFGLMSKKNNNAAD